MNLGNTETASTPAGSGRRPMSERRTPANGARTGGAKRAFSGESPSLRRYLCDIRSYPVLSRDEESALAREAQQGRKAALDRLIECNLRFVVKIASGYRNRGLPLEDLINEGNLGLIEAVHRFDPDRGVKLISCAVWWIRRSICKALSDQSRVVRLPSSQLRRMTAIRSTRKRLRDDLGREPTWGETSETMSTKPTDADPINFNGIRMLNLDDPIGRRGRKLCDLLRDDRQPSVVDRIVETERTDRVVDLFRQLDPPLKTVISCRFGLDGERRMTLVELGRRIGKSREGVRQIERNALRRLRDLSATGTAAYPGDVRLPRPA